MPKPTTPPGLQKRIASARVRRSELFSYLRQHPTLAGVIDAVLCKGCRAPIRGLVEDERFEERRTIGGQEVIYRRLIMATLPPYVEVTLAMGDGSAHVTPMCRTCALALTPADLDDLYAADLAEMEDLERRGGGRAAWHVLDRTVTKVARIVDSTGQILMEA